MSGISNGGTVPVTSVLSNVDSSNPTNKFKTEFLTHRELFAIHTSKNLDDIIVD